MNHVEYDLAPVVVVRAACWPVRVLTKLSEPTLGRLAATVDANDVDAYGVYQRQYEAAIERQRSLLWAATRGDDRFMLALAVSNPEFAERVRRISSRAARNKRVRHAETTLYRYLARAAGRTEPCDLWAGVALARWGDCTEVVPSPAECLFSPDLRPFQSMLRALSRREPYRHAGMWKANPSVTRNAEASFSFYTRPNGAAAQVKTLGTTPAMTVVIEALRDAPAGTFEELVERLRSKVEIDDASAQRALVALAGAGVLVGGIDLPSRFASAWDALGQAAGQLSGADRAAWWLAYKTLRRACRRLCAVERLHEAQIAEAMDGAAAVIRTLAGSLSVECPELPRVPLRCDLRLPFRVTFGPDMRARIERALREYDRFQAAYGLGDAFRRGGAASAPPPPRGDADGPTRRPLVTWESYAATLEARTDVSARIARWGRILAEPDAVTPPIDIDGERGLVPPFGCLLFAAGASTLSIHGIVDEVAPIYSRYTRLWHRVLRGPKDDFIDWYRDRLSALSARGGIRVCELVTPCEVNPNALARPSFVEDVVSIWSPQRSEVSLKGAELFTDPRTGQRLVRVEASARPLAVFSFSSANVGWGDPVAQLLLSTCFRVAPLAHVRASTVPFACELASPRPSPQTRLATGEIVRTRRKLVHGEELATWLAQPAPGRFASWRRWLSDLGWGPLVAVRKDQEPAVLVAVDSPLALESILEGAAADAELVTIEERSDDAWIEDADGNRYVAQFAAPFVRSRHAWSGREDDLEGGVLRSDLAASECSPASP